MASSSAARRGAAVALLCIALFAIAFIASGGVSSDAGVGAPTSETEIGAQARVALAPLRPIAALPALPRPVKRKAKPVAVPTPTFRVGAAAQTTTAAPAAVAPTVRAPVVQAPVVKSPPKPAASTPETSVPSCVGALC